VREFVELSFTEIDRKIVWQGSGVDEQGIDEANGDVLVEIDPRYFRPTEVETLLGNPAKALDILGWQHTTPFSDLVSDMVKSDLELLKRGDDGRD
jgi:GDPmannose 4,6-dehydratase